MSDGSADRPRVLILEARFYEDIADELAAGAVERLDQAGVAHERHAVPGAFELPAALTFALEAADDGDAWRGHDGYVLLGCVIRGETSHYDVVCNETARAVQDLTCANALALGFGLLTVENRDQAWARAARDRGNKGAAAAAACLHMIDLRARFSLGAP